MHMNLILLYIRYPCESGICERLCSSCSVFKGSCKSKGRKIKKDLFCYLDQIFTCFKRKSLRIIWTWPLGSIFRYHDHHTKVKEWKLMCGVFSNWLYSWISFPPPPNIFIKALFGGFSVRRHQIWNHEGLFESS